MYCVGNLMRLSVVVYVCAFYRDDLGSICERVVDLRRLEIGRHEDEGPQPGGGRGCRGRAGEVAGRGAGQGVGAELDGPRGSHGDDPILERERRVTGVVLEQEVLDTDRLAETTGMDER